MVSQPGPGPVSVIDEAIRRAAGRHVLVFQRQVATQAEGLDGGRHAPRQPEPVDMDKLISARAGKGPRPMGTAANWIPLRLE